MTVSGIERKDAGKIMLRSQLQHKNREAGVKLVFIKLEGRALKLNYASYPDVLNGALPLLT